MWLGVYTRAAAYETLPAGPASSYSTNFAATENPLAESVGGVRAWLLGGTDGIDWLDLQTSTNFVFAGAFDPGGTHDPNGCLNPARFVFATKQYAEGTVHINSSESGSHEVAVYVNMTITPHSITGYECYLSHGGAHTLVRWNGPQNNYTPLSGNNVSPFTIPVEGDVIRIENDGFGNLACYQNGVLRTTATDTTYTGGTAGIGNNPDSNVPTVALNAIGFKLFQAGNW